MRNYNFLRLSSKKVTWRSYGYFLKFAYFYFLRNLFFQLCQKLQSLIQKIQRILGIKSGIKDWSVKLSCLLSELTNIGYLKDTLSINECTTSSSKSWFLAIANCYINDLNLWIWFVILSFGFIFKECNWVLRCILVIASCDLKISISSF
jgi:hypothetical protein